MKTNVDKWANMAAAAIIFAFLFPVMLLVFGFIGFALFVYGCILTISLTYTIIKDWRERNERH